MANMLYLSVRNRISIFIDQLFTPPNLITGIKALLLSLAGDIGKTHLTHSIIYSKARTGFWGFWIAVPIQYLSCDTTFFRTCRELNNVTQIFSFFFFKQYQINFNKITVKMWLGVLWHFSASNSCCCRRYYSYNYPPSIEVWHLPQPVGRCNINFWNSVLLVTLGS